MQNLHENYDSRTELPEGTVLHLTEETDSNPVMTNHHTVRIGALLGIGGSCLTYQGVLLQKVGDCTFERNVIIKEFYPFWQEGLLQRGDDRALIIPAELQKKFDMDADRFLKGQVNHILYADEHSGNALPAAMFLGKDANTFYAVSSPGTGKVLSAVDRRKLTLADAFSIAQSICNGILHIHKGDRRRKGYDKGLIRQLYLDLKPDNVFTDGSRAYLFDFDTVQDKNNLLYCSCSAGWSAPEQKLTNTGYASTALIGFHTDIFAIAGILLWLLTGCNPDEATAAAIEAGNFDWKARIDLRNAEDARQSEPFCRQLESVMRTALDPDAAQRKKHFESSRSAETLSNQIANLADLAKNAPNARLADELKDEIRGTHGKIAETGDAVQAGIRKWSKKSILILAGIMCILFLAVIIPLLSIWKNTKNPPEPAARALDSSIESHLLIEVPETIELKDALHQYKTGLYNWKRLDYNRALRDCSEAFETVRRMRPAEDPDAAAISNSLGCLLLDMGRYAESYDYLNSANVTFQNLCGADSTEALTALFAIAQYQYSTGKTEQALRTLQEIFDTAEEKNTALRTALLIYRARICDELGNYDDAAKACRQALAEYQVQPDTQEYQYDPKLAVSEKDPDDNALRSIARIYCMLGAAELHAERTEEAEAALETGLDLALSHLCIGKENFITAQIYQNLAVLSGQKGNLKEALEQIDLAMRIERKLMDQKDDYSGLVSVYNTYGDLLMQKGEQDAAKEKYTDALTLARESFGEDHAETAEAWDHCGMYALQTGDLQTAQADFQKAVGIRRNLVSYEHCSTVGYLYHSALAYKAAGDAEQAAETAAEALRLYDIAGMQSSIRAELQALLQ